MNEPPRVNIPEIKFSDLHKLLPSFTEFYWKPRGSDPVFAVILEADECSICIKSGFRAKTDQRSAEKLTFTSNEPPDWEWFVIIRTSDIAMKELLQWRRLRNHHAANLGVADAASLTFKDLISRIEARNLDELDYILLEEIISQIVNEGGAEKFFNEESAKHRRSRSFEKMKEVYRAVMKCHAEGSAISEDGAFSEVGSKLAMSSTTVSRHYYEYKNILTIFEVGDYYQSRIEETVDPDTFNYRFKVISD
jgi:hypothetical protein